jgi:putative cell wall-binding protein
MYQRKNNSATKKKGLVKIGLLISSLMIIFPVNALAAQTDNRIAGQDRFQTATAISEKFNSGTVQDVIITSGNNFPDALSASVLAKKLNAPILLVSSTAADSTAAFGYITQHLSPSGTVHIIGGTGVIGKDFETQLTGMGYQNVERIGGADRFATDILIAQKLTVDKNTPVVIASGENFPDALSISSIASSKGWPILLVGKDYLPQAIQDYLANEQPSNVYIVGGTGVVSEDVESQVQSLVTGASIQRLAGQDRLETNALIIQTFTPSPKNIYFATGYDFADALAGSVLAAKTGDPIVLVDPSSSTLPPKIVSYFTNLTGQKDSPELVPFGGISAVPEAQLDTASSLLNVPQQNVPTTPLLPTGISLNKSNTTVSVGANETLTAVITPTDATDTSVTWKSSNPAIATVDSNGQVQGVSAGTAVITATSADENVTATCTITVPAQTNQTNPITVQNIAAVSVNTKAGVVPALPSTVTATMSDGTTQTVSVTWDSVDPSQYAAAGTFTVNGSITESATVKASALVTVSPAVSQLSIIGTPKANLVLGNLSVTVNDQTLVAKVMVNGAQVNVTPQNNVYAVPISSTNDLVEFVDATGKTLIAQNQAAITPPSGTTLSAVSKTYNGLLGYLSVVVNDSSLVKAVTLDGVESTFSIVDATHIKVLGLSTSPSTVILESTSGESVTVH